MMGQAAFLIERACVGYRGVHSKALDLKPGCRLPQHEIAHKSEKTTLFFKEKGEGEESEARNIGSDVGALTKTRKKGCARGRENETFRICRGRRDSEITQPREHRKDTKRGFYFLDGDFGVDGGGSELRSFL